MEDTSVRHVLRDLNTRSNNTHTTPVDFMSAFKPVARNNIIVLHRRRSSSVNDENRVPFCLNLCEKKSMQNIVTCGEDIKSPIDFTKKLTAGDREENYELKRENEALRLGIHSLENDLCESQIKCDNVERNSSRAMQDLQQHVVSLQRDVQMAQQQTTELGVQCDKYKGDWETALNSVHELQEQLSQYYRLDADIKEAMDVQKKAAEVIKIAHKSVKSLHCKANVQHEKLHVQKQDLIERKCEYQRMASECHSLEQRNVDCTLQLNVVREKVHLLQSEIAVQQQQNTHLLELHEQETKTLNQTLRSREHEIQELSHRAERQSRLITYQKAEHAKLLSELAVAQEVAQSFEVQLKDSLEAKFFLDQEHEIVSKELADVNVKFAQCVNENLSLSDQLMELQQRNSDLLMEHNSADSSIASISNALSELYKDLTKLSDHWVQLSAHKTEGGLPPMNSVRHSNSTSSFVGLVLNTASESGFTEADTDLSSTSESPLPTKVAEQAVINMLKTPTSKSQIAIQSTPGFSAFREPSTSRLTLHADSQYLNVVPSALDLSDSVDDIQRRRDFRLSGSLKNARTLLENVCQVIIELQQAVIHTVSSLQSQLNTLNDKMKTECASRDEVIRCAREELRELQSSASETKELADTATRELTIVRNNNLKLESDLKNARELLKQRADMNVECYDLSNNVKRLEKELSLRDCEVQTLTQTIQDRLKLLESHSGREACVKELFAENHRLKTDKTKLINSISDRQTAHETERYQLRQMNKLSSTNLKRAELALSQLDDKVERIRKALHPYADTLKMADSNLLSIMNEIGVFVDE